MRKPRIKTKRQNNLKEMESSTVEIVVPTRKYTETVLKEMIIGQDDFITRVTTAIYRRLVLGIPSNIMVIGGSGSGKTETLKSLAKILDIPYTIESATEYTQSGYVGNNIEDIISNLYKNARSSSKLKELLAIGIVIIDEIDKKAESVSIGQGKSVSGKAVQERLLNFMDGMIYYHYDYERNIEVTINTENIIFICMGAFEGLEKIKNERLHKNNIGFQVEVDSKDKNEYIESDFIKYGMIKEFMGRFDCIAETRKLSVVDFENIIEKSQISAFKDYQVLLEERNIKLEYSKELVSNIAKKAHKMNIGARAIKSVVNSIFEHIVCELIDNSNKKYSICRLGDDIVYDNMKYVLE